MSERRQIIDLIEQAVSEGVRRAVACDCLGVSLRTIQRWRRQEREDGRRSNRFSRQNALTSAECKQAVELACSPAYRDLNPHQIVAIHAEKGEYVCSESTFYRLLRKKNLLVHRSRSRAPERRRPDEITANGPNQVWSWDISYLLTLTRGSFLYLYLILDIWDRSIVGWSVHEAETGELAGRLLDETCAREQVTPGALVVHQDNGGPMISGEFLGALAMWGRPSYSRPGVSDDNPFSESLFRTVKYRPGYPLRFESLEEAYEWMQAFVEWYNTQHRHSGIGYVTPSQRRNGEDQALLETRRQAYADARAAHPERWSGPVRKWERPDTVTLNPRHNKRSRQNEAA